MNEEKVMYIDHLRTGQNNGEIGLFSLFTNRFSNFRLTHKDVVENPEKAANNPVDPNIITQWEITKERIYKEEEFYFDDFLKEKYMTVMTEKSGLLPISKYIKKSSSGNFEENEEHYTIASTTIHADSTETRLFSFDYSDKIIVYLNRKPVFRGNNAFTVKGAQYMGHIDINTNKLYLTLEKRENIIHCVIIDKANGWGLIAKFE